jgi:heme oxygenase
MLSEKLRETTKNNHQLLEKKLVQNIKSIRTKEQYSALLGLFYSFFGGMEIKINQEIDTEKLTDYLQRRKAAALGEDLQQLNTQKPALAAGEEVPQITNHLQALGALYVMEGSTLGGKIISKMIRQQIGEPHMAGLSFFNGYGEQSEAMWHRFKAVIDQPLSPSDEEVVIKAANDTFIRFRHWFDQHLS